MRLLRTAFRLNRLDLSCPWNRLHGFRGFLFLSYCTDIKGTVKVFLLDLYLFYRYNNVMKSNIKRGPGRPPKGSGEKKDEYLEVRLETNEKQAFNEAAKLAGLQLSTWVRARLRVIARKELEDADLPVAFMPKRG
jgi:hypothetical protein